MEPFSHLFLSHQLDLIQHFCSRAVHRHSVLVLDVHFPALYHRPHLRTNRQNQQEKTL